MDPDTPTLRCGAWSERGTRERNEDCAAYNPTLGFLVIADGMGGHPSGDAASAQAVDEVLQILEASPAPQEVLVSACLEAHDALSSRGDNRGTTLTAAILLGLRLHVAHVGDSRLYVNGVQITEDQGRGQFLHQFVGGDERPTPQERVVDVTHGDWIVLTTDGIHGCLDLANVLEDTIALSDGDPSILARSLAHSAVQSGSTDNCTCVAAQVWAKRDD